VQLIGYLVLTAGTMVFNEVWINKDTGNGGKDEEEVAQLVT
jgi:hypothetical protein